MNKKICSKCKVEIDHRIPVSQATTTEEEMLKLNHYLNLQWLTREDNLKKSDSLDYQIRNGQQ